MSAAAARPARILLVDDERDIREMIARVLSFENDLVAIQAASGPEALELLRQGVPDAVLLDYQMPGMDGMKVLREARKFDLTTPVIFVTGYGSISTAVEAIKAGAYDYVTKPFQNDVLVLTIRRALETRRLKQENQTLRAKVDDREPGLRESMGPSDQIRRLIGEVQRVAPTDFTVLVQGETGSGKELVARALHRASKRADGPFLSVDCGAIQPNLVESELFGHEKGAFTGADRLRQGKFEAAIGGTLFLDEVQNLPAPVQVKLLRALQERQITRVGGTRPVDIDIRVVAASNQNLLELIKSDKFRDDLYHRLNEFHLQVPALRERRDDILYLAKRFIDQTAAELNKPVPTITAPAIELLLQNSWPGNVRELRNVIRRAVLLADGPIEPEHLGRTPPAPRQRVEESPPGLVIEDGKPVSFKDLVRQSVEQAERQILMQVLKQTGGNKARAARLLQIDYKTIRTKAKQYNIPLLSNDEGDHDEEEG